MEQAGFNLDIISQITGVSIGEIKMILKSKCG